MPQAVTIGRNFYTVSQAAELGLAERTVLHYIATARLAAGPLEPEREHAKTVWPIRRKAADSLTKKRAQS